jgi:hypothetical protein
MALAFFLGWYNGLALFWGGLFYFISNFYVGGVGWIMKSQMLLKRLYKIGHAIF